MRGKGVCNQNKINSIRCSQHTELHMTAEIITHPTARLGYVAPQQWPLRSLPLQQQPPPPTGERVASRRVAADSEGETRRTTSAAKGRIYELRHKQQGRAMSTV